MDDKLLTLVNRIEGGAVRLLLVLMLVIVIFAVIQLVIGLVAALTNPPYLDLVTGEELLVIFSAFLLVLIGIELVGVIRTYLETSYIRVEFVLIVALIAVAKSVIVLDYQASPWHILSLAALMLALSIGYFLLHQANKGEQK